MKRLNIIIDYLILLIVMCLGFISRFLTIKSRGKFGQFVGRFLMISRRRKKITFDNIKTAFPEYTEERIQEILVGSYHNLGITMMELLAFPYLKIEGLRQYMKYENEDLFRQIHSCGKGMILLSGHYGNWEMLACTAGAFSKIPITIVVKPQRNKFIDHYLNQYRTMYGNSVVPMSKAAKSMIKAIKNNEAIALLVDQSADASKDIFVEFFGRKAVTYEAPASLALRLNVPIIIGFAVRTSDFTYNVELIELKHDDLSNDSIGIAELTKRHVAILENMIRKHPHLWAWQHNRWKHKVPNYANE
ncbi:MAG: lysophospholipid acyltransferase family protein [Candidatus Kapabacteria bacterium]|nr:lysophospholipid acyltransferase family protein [Candidatus Kapabacteria bacterium]